MNARAYYNEIDPYAAQWLRNLIASATVWLDGVCDDMESEGYAIGAAVLPACAVDAPHRRDRLWFVADATGSRTFPGAQSGLHRAETRARPRNVEPERSGIGALADADRSNSFWWSGPVQVGRNAIEGKVTAGGGFRGTQWRIEPSIPLLAHGISDRTSKLRAYGNAIVPQVAAQFILAATEAMNEAAE